jgi:CO dehydrogenase maturation factor
MKANSKSYVIAVAGKGGTGKTTFSALVIEALRRKRVGPILAVDADPNYTLGALLGIPVRNTVSGILEEAKGLRAIPDGLSKQAYLEYKLQQIVIEGKGVDLLVMGHPEGPQCYCQANNILRGYINDLSKNYRYIVMDNEAGMEHLNRKTTQDIDALFLVSDPTRIGLHTAQRIKELIDKLTFLTIKSRYLVLNKAKEEHLSKPIIDIGIPLIGHLPYAPELPELELAEQPLATLPDNSELLKSINAILDSMAM